MPMEGKNLRVRDYAKVLKWILPRNKNRTEIEPSFKSIKSNNFNKLIGGGGGNRTRVQKSWDAKRLHA